MRSVRDIAWLAGLVEGEGTFTICGRGIQMKIGMTDRDVIERAVNLTGGRMYGPYQSKPGNKPCFDCILLGMHAAGWMMILWTFMGERRKAKIERILAHWRVIRKKGPVPKVAVCHPERKHKALGLCVSCYGRCWREGGKAFAV